jgi:nicotinamidase/pyrazinamidase
MPNHCILIIDPQKDFIHVDGIYAKRHAGITQMLQAKTKINELLQAVEPQNIVIVYANYAPNQFAAGLSICIPNTWGHAIDIDANEKHLQFSKITHSAFSSVAFVAHLQQNNITQLFLCGFLAEYCVLATALDAIANGYAVSILVDCVCTADDKQERKTEMLKELKQHNIVITDSDVFLAAHH